MYGLLLLNMSEFIINKVSQQRVSKKKEKTRHTVDRDLKFCILFEYRETDFSFFIFETFENHLERKYSIIRI